MEIAPITINGTTWTLKKYEEWVALLQRAKEAEIEGHKLIPHTLHYMEETPPWISKSEKQSGGVFYTPRSFCIILALCSLDVSKFDPSNPDHNTPWGTSDTLLDPCCGCANLFKGYQECFPWHPTTHFFGIDIDKKAIAFCLNDPDLPGAHFQYADFLKCSDYFYRDSFWNKEPLSEYVPSMKDIANVLKQQREDEAKKKLMA
ncbi:hypothetical protein AGMMS50268_38630 [Spirochaetia bacterium]|nr:hypothetical protein FACS189491_06710 [Spirochaetia bacterium]GHV93360.1 hypothetical protein AGMMS50268_38630 [Spirochaetia bacterium]